MFGFESDRHYHNIEATNTEKPLSGENGTVVQIDDSQQEKKPEIAVSIEMEEETATPSGNISDDSQIEATTKIEKSDVNQPVEENNNLEQNQQRSDETKPTVRSLNDVSHLYETLENENANDEHYSDETENTNDNN